MSDRILSCRRTISKSQDDQGAPCGRRITKRNALNWCEACRAARLPLWPANDQAPKVLPHMIPFADAVLPEAVTW